MGLVLKLQIIHKAAPLSGGVGGAAFARKLRRAKGFSSNESFAENAQFSDIALQIVKAARPAPPIILRTSFCHPSPAHIETGKVRTLRGAAQVYGKIMLAKS